MSSREVLVTYTLYPTGNGDLRTALSGLEDQLPLRNLHWKPTSRTALRTIQEVDLKLVELGDLPPKSDKPFASLLENPMVNVCFIACDDSDIYKNNTRTFIKDWMSLVASRDGSHLPLIVLVNPPTASGATHSSKNVFGRDRGIIAKLKADFNTAKKDICVQINLPPAGTVDPAVWPEMTSRLKDSIVAAFDSAILAREDEVKRGETQRVNPGWDFCSWFLLKESLAMSFEGVSLYEDALLIYEELEASFFQCVKERNIAWFWRMGGTGSQDDSFRILNTSAKRYRDLLLGNLITVFDFRIYVFACQCLLLGKLGRITEIAKRGQWFVASLAGRLREHQYTLPDHFIESWTYSACMDLVEHCDEWSRVDRPNNDYSGLIAYESARSELLDIARVQVERLGLAAGHLPNIYPFRRTTELPIIEKPQSPTTAEGRRPSPSPNTQLSNQTFLAALKSQETFLDLYRKLTTEALDAYAACGKVNSALRLKVDLAALALHLNEWATAYDLYRSLARESSELHVWDRVSAAAVEGALQAHSQLRLARDDDWAYLALAYLRTCSSSGLSDNLDMLKAVISGLRELDDSRQESDNRVFVMRVLDHSTTLTDDVSVTELSLQVTNELPVEIAVDNVSVDLESPTFGTINYVSGPATLRPGRQTLTISCSTSISGMTSLVQAAVYLGNVSFTSEFPKEQTMIATHRNLQGPRTVLHMPENLSLDEEPHVVLDIHTGKQDMNNASVILTSLQNETGYALDRATAKGHDLQPSPNSVGLGSLGKDTTLRVSIPYSGLPRNELAKVQIMVEYESIAGRQAIYIEEQSIFMGLPITVNVQDFFRPNALVSSFVIASDGHEYVRVKSVDLKSPSDDYLIEACRTNWDDMLLVSPSHKLSCVFRVKPNKTPPTGEVLRLAIQYRTVGEEVELAAQAALNTLPMPSAPLVRHIRDQLADRASWLQPYLLSSDAATVFNNDWVASLPADVAGETAKQFITALDPGAVRWRTLRIPVDVALRRHLTTVRLAPVTPGTLYEGRALTFEVEFTTSLSWLGDWRASVSPADKVQVTYDIQPSADDWIVVGKKRGTYIADPENPQVEKVVLVPVRHGVLSLPPVAVQLVESKGPHSPATPSAQRLQSETFIANAAQGVRVLPAKTGMTTLVPISGDD